MTASELAEQIKTIEQALQILKKDRYSEDVEECGVLFGKALDIAIQALEQTQDREPMYYLHVDGNGTDLERAY